MPKFIMLLDTLEPAGWDLDGCLAEVLREQWLVKEQHSRDMISGHSGCAIFGMMVDRRDICRYSKISLSLRRGAELWLHTRIP